MTRILYAIGTRSGSAPARLRTGFAAISGLFVDGNMVHQRDGRLKAEHYERRGSHEAQGQITLSAVGFKVFRRNAIVSANATLVNPSDRFPFIEPDP